MKENFFITFEGGEGTGKSTQARLLADFLEKKGISCLLTREPGGSAGAEEIRNLVVKGEVGRWDVMTETLLMFAARRDHLVNVVWPALKEGKTVICDRFADSTMAYQGFGYAEKGVGPQTVEQLYQIVVGSVLLLNIPVAYLFLENGYPIETPLIISAAFIMIGNIVRLAFCKRQLGLSLRQYNWEVLVPIMLVTALSVVLPIFIHINMAEGWGRLLLTVLVSSIAVAFSVYAVGLTSSERKFMVSWVAPKIKRMMRLS